MSKEETIEYIYNNRATLNEAEMIKLAQKNGYSFSHIKSVIYKTQPASTRLLNIIKTHIDKLQKQQQ